MIDAFDENCRDSLESAWILAIEIVADIFLRGLSRINVSKVYLALQTRLSFYEA